MDSTDAPNDQASPIPSIPQVSLSQAEAELGLKWLKSRSELIRLELLTHELELALLQARNGNSKPLDQWFLNHGTPWQTVPQATTFPTPTTKLPIALGTITTQPHPSEPILSDATDIALATSPTATHPQTHQPQTEKKPATKCEPTKSPDNDSGKKLFQAGQPNKSSTEIVASSLSTSTPLATTSPNQNATTKQQPNPASPAPQPEITSAGRPSKENATSKDSQAIASRPSNQKTVPRHSSRNVPANTKPSCDSKRNSYKAPPAKGPLTRPRPLQLNRSGPSTATEVANSPTPPSQQQPKGKTSAMLTSLLLHAALIIGLMLFTLPMPESKPTVGLTGSISTAEPFPLEIENNTPLESPNLANEPLTDSVAATEPTEIVSELTPTSADISEAITTTSLKPVLPDNAGLESSLLQTSANHPSQDALSDTSKLSRASFFGLETAGNLLCFVVDASGSMRGDPFQATKLELLRSISQLKSNQRFCVLFFNQKLIPMQLDGPLPDPSKPQAAYATPENLLRLQTWMETVAIGIGGPPNQALQAAIGLEPDAIFLLTDGITKSDVMSHLKKTNIREDWLDGPQIRCPIHTIGFYSRDGEVLLQQIANENGGQYRYVPNPQPDSKTKKMER